MEFGDFLVRTHGRVPEDGVFQGPDRTQGRDPEAEFKDYVYWEPRFFFRGFFGSLKFSVVPTILKLCGFS